MAADFSPYESLVLMFFLNLTHFLLVPLQPMKSHVLDVRTQEVLNYQSRTCEFQLTIVSMYSVVQKIFLSKPLKMVSAHMCTEMDKRTAFFSHFTTNSTSTLSALTIVPTASSVNHHTNQTLIWPRTLHQQWNMKYVPVKINIWETHWLSCCLRRWAKSSNFWLIATPGK